MITRINKRNGETAPFDQTKITDAIFKAAKACGGNDYRKAQEVTAQVVERIQKRFHKNSIPAIEEIQDIVEETLIDLGHAKVAKAYILYREQRSKVRDAKKLALDIEKTMHGYLHQSDWRVNENANVNYSLGGLILHNSGAITANYWLHNIYTKDIAEAHQKGDFHLHDLSMFSGYCAGWSLGQLVREGLGGVKNKISSKPAKHLATLVNQMVNFLGVLQNEWAGAQAFSSFDTHLAPFVKYGNLSYNETKQCIQSFLFGINTPSRWGSQSPFSNITLDWVAPTDLRDTPAVVGGEDQPFTYGDCQKEMDMINKAFLEVMLEGDADGRGFAYPIPTYNITRDFDWDNENTDLLFEMAAKYGTPYFQNFVNSDLDPSDVRSMCCRLQLDKRELRRRGGGLFGADEFTGSIGVVTVNLPRIGYLSKTETEFFNRLARVMDIARDSLEVKRDVITKLMDQGLFPYTKRYLKHWNNHFSTIGLNGMNECALNFMKKDIADEAARAFAARTLTFMRERISRYQEETGNLYNLEATPGESTSYRLAKIDKEMYPDIVTSGTPDAPYYTNSTQLPVMYTDDVFHALDLQEDLQTLYTGGTVFHAYLGERMDNAACKALVKKIAYAYRLPYYTISPTFSVCPDHGYLSGEQFQCPTCGNEAEVYARIVGYYRPLSNWNKGKHAEYQERVTFSVDSAPAEQNGAERGAPLEPEIRADEILSADALQMEYPIQRYVMLYTRTCQKCPAVKEYLLSLPIEGAFLDASVDERAQALAEEHGVRSAPAVFLYGGNDALVKIAFDLNEVKEALLTAVNQ